MTELSRHIEILLLDNDCVIVPGFGGFMAHHSVAVFNEEEDIFLPPSRTLGFNSQLRINDSLLAQSYVEAYDISYPEAVRRIESDVDELRQHLENEGECELQNIGVLSVNADGNYDFRPCDAGILSPALYALNLFEMSPLAKSVTLEEHAEKPVAEQNSTVETTMEVYPNEPVEEENTSRVISIRVETVKHMLAAAAALIFFILISVPLGESTHTDTKLCSIDSEILERIFPGMEVKGNVPNFLRPSVLQKEVETSVEEVKQESDVQKENTTFFAIVLASHVSKVNADGYVEKLRAEGVKDARVLEQGKFRKVVCGNFSTKMEANESLNNMRHDAQFADAWVVEVK